MLLLEHILCLLQIFVIIFMYIKINNHFMYIPIHSFSLQMTICKQQTFY